MPAMQPHHLHATSPRQQASQPRIQLPLKTRTPHDNKTTHKPRQTPQHPRHSIPAISKQRNLTKSHNNEQKLTPDTDPSAWRTKTASGNGNKPTDRVEASDHNHKTKTAQDGDFPAGAAPPTPAVPSTPGEKAANLERDRAIFRAILQQADRPWHHAGTQQPPTDNPAPQTTDDTSTRPTSETPAQATTAHDPTTAPTTQPDDDAQADNPPPVPHSPDCDFTYCDLTHGCHSFHITLKDPDASRSSSSNHALPHVFVTGECGAIPRRQPALLHLWQKAYGS